jgi:hypothetical protein
MFLRTTFIVIVAFIFATAIVVSIAHAQVSGTTSSTTSSSGAIITATTTIGNTSTGVSSTAGTTSSTIGTGTGTITPGIPNTGAGGNAANDIALLILSGSAVAIGISYLIRAKAS